MEQKPNPAAVREKHVPRSRSTVPGAARWEAALDVVQGYVLIVDRDRRVRLMNRAPPGRKVDDFLGRDFTDFVAADQRALITDAIQRILDGAATVNVEVRSAESDRWFHARITGILEQGVVSEFAVHALDVDDAMAVELERDVLRAKLRAASGHSATSATSATSAEADTVQRRLELMADALPVLISYIDHDRRYQYNNLAYTRWFGTAREEMRGRSLPEVLGPAAYEQIRGYVDAVLGGRAVSFEQTLPYRHAGVRRVIAHYVPDMNSVGEVVGFFALIEDVTARRTAEDDLRRREDEVRQLQKMEALGRLAGGIAHDFSNLLQSIITNCSVLLLSLPIESAAEAVARIKRSAERGTFLTRELLAFSRSEELTTGTLDLDAVLADVEMLLERLLESNVRLESDHRCCCHVEADAGQIQQVMMNLAINARDAMPEGGTLRIETQQIELTPDDAARHVGVRPGSYALICVSDTGTGMDGETVKRIFDPFFTTKPPERGTGLGLSMVYGIVQSLNGFIEVDSAPGEGTTFRLYIPCTAPDLSRPAGHRPAE